jgi:hypothetical protein
MKQLASLGGLALALAFLPPAGRARAEPKVDRGFGKPHIDAVEGPARVIKDGRVIDFGKTIYRGKIDVNPTLERVRAGKKLEHRNDGAIFRNREGKLPRKRDPNYYREFVHHFRKMPFPGPQRVIVGKGGEVYYSGDHYHSFTRVR